MAVLLELSAVHRESLRALEWEYGYTPAEVISLGIAIFTYYLKSQQAGNEIAVIDPRGVQIARIKPPEPKAIEEVARAYILSSQV